MCACVAEASQWVTKDICVITMGEKGRFMITMGENR